METYATWVRLFELQRHYSWIVDRFHISTMMWQAEPVRRPLRLRQGAGGAARARRRVARKRAVSGRRADEPAVVAAANRIAA